MISLKLAQFSGNEMDLDVSQDSALLFLHSFVDIT